MKINLIEKTGISVDGKEILLGNTIETAKVVLGTYDEFENNYYFLDGTLLFVADALGKIIEIEARTSDDEKPVVTFQTLEIFKEDKEVVLSYITAANKEPLSNDTCTYTAENLGISFSFGMSEEDIEDLIAESKNDGVYEEMKEEIEQDIYRSRHIESFLIRL